MKFSVLMSIYKNEDSNHFVQSLESVIYQTLQPTEIVIVKDGKLNEMLDQVCFEYKNKYPSLFNFVALEENRGLGEALRVGLKYCQYDIIARMDTDDIAKPDRFEKQVKEFEKDSLLTIVGTSIEEFSTTTDTVDSIRKVPLTNEQIRKYAKMRNPFNHMTVMFKKRAVLEVGNYQPFHLCEDYHLWFRLLNGGYQAKNLPESLVFARVNKNMFRRRGGLKYFIQEIRLQNIFYRQRFINEFEYIRNVSVRMVMRLMPNNIREYLYRRLMRH